MSITEHLLKVDWYELFTLKLSLLELLVRGVVVYLCLLLLLRVVLKRQVGKIALSDLVVVSVVAGVCRNPLIADDYSLTDGVIIIVVILGCGYVTDWLSYYSPTFHQLVHPAEVLLIKNGEIQQEGLARELMTEKQLLSQIRMHGVAHPNEVQEARMENDGKLSVLRKTSCPHCGAALY